MTHFDIPRLRMRNKGVGGGGIWGMLGVGVISSFNRFFLAGGVFTMPSIKRSGGQVLVDGLVGYGVKHVFCVPGESYLAALDAFYDHRRRVRLIVCRQEGGAAYMAEAYGKLSGQPGICFVSRGPGASNAMIGIHTAFQDSTPLLLFIGQNPRNERGREAFQELDYRRVYDGVAKAVLRIEQAEDIPQQLCDAWAMAICDRPGPVVIELPEDMLRDRVIAADCEKPLRPIKTPPPEAVERFSELLQKSTQPVIIFGGAAWTPRTNRALAAFSEKHHIPAACAFRRQDMFDNTHAHYIGELGIAPNPDLADLVKGSDLIIALGARLGEMTTSGYTLFEGREFDSGGRKKLVHVFPSAAELNSVYRAELGIDCDAEAFLNAVETIPSAARTARAAHTARAVRIAAARLSYVEFMQRPRDQGARLRMDQIMAYLRARLPSGSIIANGAGNYTVWAQRNYQFCRPKTQLAATNGSMGYGVPAAIAAKLLHPKSMVVSFSGDGCFLMNGQELATAIQHRLNVVFLILNNHSYGTIRTHQQRHYPDRPIATALENPDFAALARAYGAFGALVRETGEFENAFEQAVRANRPAVIEIQMESTENVER